MSNPQTRQAALSRFVLFLALVLALGCGGLSYLAYQTKSRLDQVENTVQRLDATAAARKTAPQAGQYTDEVKLKLRELESQQNNIAASSKNALEQMQFVFAVVASFFGLFAAFSAYRQLLADSGQEKRDQEMLGLVGQFRQNITVINELIGTLQKTFEFRGEVETRMQRLDSEIEQINAFKQRSEQSVRERIDAINAQALALFRLPLDRQSFKREEIKGKLQTLYVSMSAIERTAEDKHAFNPFAYFCRGLHFFNQMQYEPAAKADLELARRMATADGARPRMSLYGEITEGELKQSLERLISDSSYHLGIIHYNLGKLEEARIEFLEACSLDRFDFRSRIYIPELMFFDPKVPFAQVQSEFETVNRELDALSPQERRELKVPYEEAVTNLKLREGNIYLPKAISLKWRAGYQEQENKDLAVRCYEAAFNASQTAALKQTLTHVFAAWSLAQALEFVGPAQWGLQQPQRLYQDVFGEVSKQIVFKTEPVVLVQLNYVLAVCAAKAYRGAENPRTYLSRAREQMQRVPDHIQVFSPMNKVIMTRKQLLDEMDLFEQSIAGN